MPVSFNFHKFDNNASKKLILQGDATTTESNVLALTEVDSDGNPLGARVGRVLYSTPVHLYDRHGLLASFETRFTFRISSPVDEYDPGPGDGLAFFITKPDAEIPTDSFGKYLGLYTESDGVVAVEFDTYPNPEVGDPRYKHVGINVNSVKSSAVAEWDWQDGEVATAKVTYNSASGRLSVESSYPNGSRVNVHYGIKLNTILPAKVRVGLSASTGQFSQVNEVLSWSFKSN